MPLLENTLNNYRNRIFIETGTNTGVGIRQALDCGFEEVISIELSEYLFNLVLPKFSNNSNVKILLGDSAKVLPSVLEKINEPVTFWLDGHYSGDDTALGDVNSPLMFELEAIKNHHIKTHTILIDDLRCWKNKPNEYPKEHCYSNDFDVNIIKNKLLEINPDYNLEIINGPIINDILAAKII